MVVARPRSFRYGRGYLDHTVWLAYGRSGAVACDFVCRDVYFRRGTENSRNNKDRPCRFCVSELDDALARGFANSAAIRNLFLEQLALVRMVLLWTSSPVNEPGGATHTAPCTFLDAAPLDKSETVM